MKKYDDDSIKALSDIEHIRARPTMYISSDRPSLQMVTEILDNAQDEIMNGYSDYVGVNIDYDKNVISIEDHGRGLPQGMNKELNIPTIYAIYQKLNAGGKYNNESYLNSGGQNGVGSTVVNALSETLDVISWRKYNIIEAHFKRGADESYELKKTDDKKYKNSGTLVTYKIDKSHFIFTDNLRDYDNIIKQKLVLLKTLNPCITIRYQNKDVSESDFREFLLLSKKSLLDESIKIHTKDYVLALNWSIDTNRSTEVAYCNYVFNKDGGDHVRAIQDSLIDIFKSSDITYGLNLAVSCFSSDVLFQGQDKVKAVSKSLREFLKTSIISELKSLFRSNPDLKVKITDLMMSKRVDLDKRKKSNIKQDRKSSFLSKLDVDGFVDCTTKDRSEAEIFLVEGKSAGGSARQARNTVTQAIMPLRGKPLNASRASIKDILNNVEISQIIRELGTDVFDNFNIDKLRYNKIIIMADADVDGEDISGLLIVLFYVIAPEIVRQGCLYLALPPLYGTTVNGKFIAIHTEEERQQYLDTGHTIMRFKGLGEMSPEELSLSCMNPESRQLIQIQDSEASHDLVLRMRGDDANERRQLLIEAGILY